MHNVAFMLLKGLLEKCQHGNNTRHHYNYNGYNDLKISCIAPTVLREFSTKLHPP